ncbi:MAG: Phage tail tape measure protein family, core region [Frankiales bacterium]|nr:Phage tail tape measure protein family, core region [Frankiales bacterium]
MALSKDVVIRLLGDASSAIAAQKAAADAAEVSVSQYRKAERELAKVQAAEQATHDARKKSMAEASQSAMMLGGALLLAFGVAANAAAEFDKAMSGVGAATMANAAQMKQLRQAALDAGAATMYSATDAANAETELAKAGISVRDILNGGLIGALNLAAAGQMDVATAAGIAATSLQQFHLNGSQASHVADLLAAGSNKALGSVEDLAGALKYVGPVAAGMGVSIDQTVGTLASFAQAGILGEQAGTSLRGVISALSSPSKMAANEMETLGINVFDAQGKFIGLDGVAGQLHDSMKDLTEQQRSQALGMIFGNEQLTSARVLYSEGAKGVQDWTGKVNDSGYAARQAAKLTDNLTGDIERLGGSLSTVLIKGGSGSTDVLRFLAQAAEGTVNAFGDLPGPLAAASVGLVGIVGAGTAVLGIVGTMIPKIQTARESLRGLGAVGSAVDSGLGKVAKVGGYATLAVAGVSALAAAYDAMHPPAEIVIADQSVLIQQLVSLANSADHAASSVSSFDLGRLITQLRSIDTTAWATKESLGTLGKAGAFVGDAFSGVLPNALGDGQEALQKLSDANAQATQSVKDTDDALASMISSGHPEAATTAFDKIMKAASAQGLTMDQLKAKFPQYVAALQGYVGESTYTVDASGAVTNALGEQKSAADQLKQSWDALNGIGTNVVQGQAEWTLALDSLSHGAASASRSLDINTSAGAKNTEQLITVAGKARDLAAAIGDQKGYNAGVKASNSFRSALIEQAVKAGYSRDKVVALMDSIFHLDNTNSTSDLKAIDKVSPAVANANRQLDTINGRVATVTLTTVQQTVQQLIHATPIYEAPSLGKFGMPVPPKRAEGGPVWPGTFLVGEHGPELLQMGGHGFVTPADMTKQVMASLGAHVGTSRAVSSGTPVGVAAGSRGGGSGGTGPMQFVGDLYLDSGEFLGKVRGVADSVVGEAFAAATTHGAQHP